MTPHREDFIRWLEDPVTGYVMRAHLAMAEAQKAAWDGASWENGHANPLLLAELRVRADAYRAIAEMTYDGVCEANGDEPNDE